MKIKNRIYFTYDDIMTMCHDLVFQLEPEKVDLVVGIKRGGVVAALHLSHELEKPMEVITWQTRDENEQEDNLVIREMIEEGRRVVFVDDINDSRRPCKEVLDSYAPNGEENVLFASLIEKTSTDHTSHFSSLQLGNSKWIVFPWEKV